MQHHARIGAVAGDLARQPVAAGIGGIHANALAFLAFMQGADVEIFADHCRATLMDYPRGRRHLRVRGRR